MISQFQGATDSLVEFSDIEDSLHSFWRCFSRFLSAGEYSLTEDWLLSFKGKFGIAWFLSFGQLILQLNSLILRTVCWGSGDCFLGFSVLYPPFLRIDEGWFPGFGGHWFFSWILNWSVFEDRFLGFSVLRVDGGWFPIFGSTNYSIESSNIEDCLLSFWRFG